MKQVGRRSVDPSTSPTPRSLVLSARLALLVGAVLIVVVRPGLWLSFVTVALGFALAWLSGWRGHQLRTVALALAVIASAVDYLSWRVSVIAWSTWFVAVPLFLAELHAALHTAGLQVSLWPRATPPLRNDQDPFRLPIVILVPTVSEGAAIVEQTLVGVLAARSRYLAEHPAASVRVVVCNDGAVAGAKCSDDIIALADRLGVECVTRTSPGGAKAGNIEHARQLTGGTGDALLVIFDADQVPLPTFLLNTVPPFRDASMGWVQTGQYYRNRTNPVARWADDQQSLFYRLLCPAKAAHDAVFICGTNVVLRASALDEIGGLPTDSVTEDFAASILLAPKWRSSYLPGVYATGLGPVDFPSYLKQQERWARGTLTVLRHYGHRIIWPGRDALRPSQRLQYALAMTHYLCGLRDVIFVVAPVLYVFTGLSGVQGADLSQFLQHFVPYYLLALVAFWHAGWRTTSWRAIVLGFASTPALLKATWMTTLGRRGRFVITSKRRDRINPWRTAAPFLVALSAILTAFVVALTVRRGAAVWLAAAWLGYLAVMLAAASTLVAVDARLGRKEAVSRPPAARLDNFPATKLIIRSENGGRLAARRRRVRPRRQARPVLVSATAVLVAVVGTGVIVLASGRTQPVAGPPVFSSGRARLGVSGVTTAAVTPLATQLVGTPTIEGRTFEVGAPFDYGWARRVASGGGVPWINLVFTKSGHITLDASLTAIGNGADDNALQGWAQQLSAYGRPVYLTALSETDRNFGTSSAVARDGIPADAPRAWEHIRALFAAAGVRNVAWVWTPADPGHDQSVSPPANQVDAVAVTMYEYPDTTWTAPDISLAAAAARHPGKPLLVDVSAAGVSKPNAGIVTTRAQWLASVTRAVAARRDVAALVYHGAGPYTALTDPGAAAWSLTNDPAALAAARTSFAQLTAEGTR